MWLFVIERQGWIFPTPIDGRQDSELNVCLCATVRGKPEAIYLFDVNRCHIRVVRVCLLA